LGRTSGDAVLLREEKFMSEAQVQGRGERLATAGNLISEALDIVALLADEMETLLDCERPDERDEQESVGLEIALEELDKISERIVAVGPGEWRVESGVSRRLKRPGSRNELVTRIMAGAAEKIGDEKLMGEVYRVSDALIAFIEGMDS
jgi:hypothetical protein